MYCKSLTYEVKLETEIERLVKACNNLEYVVTLLINKFEDSPPISHPAPPPGTGKPLPGSIFLQKVLSLNTIRDRNHGIPGSWTSPEAEVMGNSPGMGLTPTRAGISWSGISPRHCPSQDTEPDMWINPLLILFLNGRVGIFSPPIISRGARAQNPCCLFPIRELSRCPLTPFGSDFRIHPVLGSYS